MSRVGLVISNLKPKPQFADLWDALIESYQRELPEIPKIIAVQGNVLGDVVKRLKTECETKFEEIDRKYERRFLALAVMESET